MSTSVGAVRSLEGWTRTWVARMRSAGGCLWRALSVLLSLVVLIPAPATVAAAQPALALQVELDPTTRQLFVQAELRPAQAAYRFVLHEALRPSAARAGARALDIRALGQRGALRAWQVDNRAGEALVLHYGGTLPALDGARDHRSVLRAMPPMASAQGSYLPAGSAWYPRPDAELFDYAVQLVVKGGQRALVAGRLLEEMLPGGAGDDYRARFVFEQLTDGIDLMAGPYAVRERLVTQADGRPLRLRTYFPPALDAEPDLANAYLDDSQRYIERYAAQIGAYPFTEFSVVASPLPTGFGMPTLTYIGEQVLRLPFIRATSLGHEVLHNWWGNGVMVDYGRGNWSEGLTTFMADHAYKREASAAGAREMRLGWLRDFAALPADAHTALVDFRSRTHGAAAAVGYGKAAMLFVMLEDEIGEEAFARGIRLFWTQQRFRIADWGALQRAFETAAGRSLEGFFHQWLTVPGGPAPRLEGARLTDDAGGGAGARLRLTLSQADPVHALRLPVRVQTGERAQTFQVRLDSARAEVELDVGFVPEAVTLDPELRVWRLPEPDQLPPILRQWMVATAPRLVVADALVEASEGGEGGEGGDGARSREVEQAARALAARLFEREPMRGGFQALLTQGGPVLLAGTEGAVRRVLERARLPVHPEELPPGGSARVWTVQRAEGPPLAVVAGIDAAAVSAVQRPLPHYGSQSWLVFDGARIRARGVWEAPGRAVLVER